MSIPNREIGWSQEAILMHKILKILQLMTRSLSSGAPAQQTTDNTTTTIGDNGGSTTSTTTEFVDNEIPPSN